MKNFTKILLAVVAVVAFSCTTDTTQDLGVGLGNNGGLTEITLSLEASRTQLGEKAGDLYPLQWSEGDKISVNGVESNALSAENVGKTTATFSVAGTPAKPYCIAYPAAPAGQVLFADKQVHTSNATFASGVATMYAYAEDGFGVSLNHLTGVLKIGVVGSAKLVLAQISNANRKPIAGAFDFDFEKGEATATASSKELIEYSFGEGVQLSSKPTYIHAVVPAGEYDELYVTLYDEDGGVMYATVKANEEKPLAAGKVREFSNSINYTPDASVFVVRDVASLRAFADQAATLDKDVLFVADVDMTGEEWTPIDGYAGTVRGNGYAIKGLTAPLFHITNASIKGLHLKDVNIVSNDVVVMGALVCNATATETIKPVIENCSVSGSFTVENKTYAPTTKDLKTALFYGGLVGISNGVDLKDCVNYASITVKQSIASNCTTSSLCYPSGVVGKLDTYLGESNKVYANIDGCINRGPILIHDTTQPEGAGQVAYWMGGVVSYVTANNTVEGFLANCKNDAPITITEINNFAGQYCQIGGVIGIVAYQANNLYEISNCENTENGDITVTGKGNHMYLGGIAGYNYNCAHTNITNRGDINVSANFTNNLFVAGCLASPGLNDSDAKHKFTADAVNNYGKVTVTGSGSTFYVGGVMGRASQGTFTDCHNYGEVTASPTIEATTTINMGGFEAVGIGDSDAGTNTNCSNEAPVTLDITGVSNLKQLMYAGYSGYCHHPLDNCSNNATLTLKGIANLTTRGLLEDSSTDSSYSIGGLSGYKASKGITNSTNTGNIIIDTEWKFNGTGDATKMPADATADKEAVTAANSGAPIVLIGGMAGRTHQPIGATNSQSGKILFKGSSDTFSGFIAIGGVVGASVYSTEGFTNAGDIHVVGNHTRLNIGGCNGYIHRYSQKATLKNASNSGNIYIGIDEDKSVVHTTFTVGPYIGGITGYGLSSIQGCSNSGNIEWEASMTAEATSSPHFGGCIGYAQTVGSTAIDTTFSDLTNSGDISVKGNLGNAELKVGGIAGYVYASSTQTRLTNSGDIYVELSATSAHMRIGGIAYGIRNALSDCTNNGNITVKGLVGKSLYVGGIVMNPNGYSRTNLTNNGDIYVDATINTDCFLGGMCYELTNGNITYSNCHNTGDITLAKTSHVKGAIALGGLIAKFAPSTATERKTIKGCSNSGNIHSAAKCNNASRLGGMLGYCSSGIVVITDGFVNTGDVTHTGTTDGADAIYVGGIAGYISGANSAISYVSGENTVTWTGDIVNKGTITGAGKSIGGQYRVAGLITSIDKPLPATAHYVNLGDIVFTGDAGTKNGTKGVATIGGVVATLTNSTIENAEAYCTITAQKADYLGFIVGTPRSTTVIAKNCKIGGVTLGEWDDEDQVYEETKINSTNYHNFIYGSGKNTDWTGTDNYDGCTLLTSAPTFE